jgi:hypothetical protein
MLLNGITIPIVGAHVTRCIVDPWSLTICVGQEESACLLRISGRFTFLSTDTLELNPEAHAPEQLGPVLRLIGHAVTSAVATTTGTLKVVFDDSAEIHVPSDHDYEAWTVTCESGWRAVCTPGGDIVIWSAR